MCLYSIYIKVYSQVWKWQRSTSTRVLSAQCEMSWLLSSALDGDLFPSQICHHKCHELTALLQRGSRVEEEMCFSLLLLSDGPLVWMTHMEDVKPGSLMETYKWRSSQALKQLSGQVCPDFLCEVSDRFPSLTTFQGICFSSSILDFSWICTQVFVLMEKAPLFHKGFLDFNVWFYEILFIGWWNEINERNLLSLLSCTFSGKYEKDLNLSKPFKTKRFYI